MERQLYQVQKNMKMNRVSGNTYVDRLEKEQNNERNKWAAERDQLLNQILNVPGEYISDEKLQALFRKWRGGAYNFVSALFDFPRLDDPQIVKIIDGFTNPSELPLRYILEDGNAEQPFSYVAQSWLFRIVLGRTSAYFCPGLIELWDELHAGKQQGSRTTNDKERPGEVGNTIRSKDGRSIDQIFNVFEAVTGKVLDEKGCVDCTLSL